MFKYINLKKIFSLNKILYKIRRIIFIFKSKKISKILRQNFKGKKIYIYDFGAGLRYLPTLLKFDGISEIYLVDPNENLDISYNNLKKIFLNKKSIKKFKVGISNKNAKLTYYPAKVSTGSSFLNLNNRDRYDDEYFGKNKSVIKNVYDFQKFKKKFKLNQADVVKIDVEGFEINILKSILKKDKPLIIEVELNFEDSIIGNTFNEANHLMWKNNYKLATMNNVFKKLTSEEFISGDYHNPIYRNSLSQSDCHYILKKRNYTIRDIIILIGYGFLEDAYKNILKIKKENTFQVTELKSLLKRIM